MQLKITPAEYQLLAEVLEERHSALERQICRTDYRQFKLALLEKEKLLESLRGKVASEVAVA